ncbi:cbb3-type cytochrome c oxidase subunit I [Roseivivax sp. CAU 1761]
MGLTIGSLIVVSFIVSVLALGMLVWAISRSQMGFKASDSLTIFEAEGGRTREPDDPSISEHHATPPTGPDGRPTGTGAASRAVLLAFVIAVLFLLGGSVFGMVASIKLHAPDWLNGSAPGSFGRVRPVHLNAVVYGWLSVGFIGMALWLIPVIFGTRLRLPWFAIAGMILWSAGTISGVVQIGYGKTEGLEWLEIPWQWDFIMAVGVGLIAASLMVTVLRRSVHHIYVTGWYYLAAFLWFPILFVVANVPGLHSGAQQATVNWWFAHNVLGLWLTPLGVGAAYYLLPRIIGKPVYSYAISLLGFWGLALFYSQVGIHHLIGGPVPTWAVTLSVVQSVMMFIPVIAVAINQHPLWIGNLDVFKASLPLRFVALGALAYTLASFQGSLQALRGFNTVVHFTHYTVGHAHHGVYAFSSLILFGGMYYVIPRLVGRVWPSHRLIVLHFWLVVLGFTIYFVALTIGGWLQGSAMLDASRPFMESVIVTKPYLVARSVGGGMMTLGHFVFALNFALMLAGYSAARERAPAPDAAAPAGGGGDVR